MTNLLKDPNARDRLGGARRRVRVALVAVVVAVGAAGAWSALAQPADHDGPPGGPGGMAMFGGPAAGMARHVDRMIDGLGVTPAQRTQIRQIIMAASADVKAQHDAGRGLRERGLQIFTAPTVDAGAAESLRQEMATQRDHESRRMLEAMLDIAKVLTPEQRAKIGARMQERQAIMEDRRQRMAQEHRPPHPQPSPQKP